MHFVSKILAALLCILLAASPAGAGSMTLLGVGKAGGAVYTAQGVNIGLTTTINRSAALTSVVDGKVGTISFWFKAEGSDAAVFQILGEVAGATSPVLIQRLNTSDVLRFGLQNAAGAQLIFSSTTATFAVGGGWKHVLASWNAATTTFVCYVNDVADISTTMTNDVIAYATAATDWQISPSGQQIDGSLADFYFDPTTFTDLTVVANRRKFISAGGAPVNLGVAGATPTGTSPAIFLSGTVASPWNTNKGTGGGFTVTTGAISAASTNPP